jgi:hypothetical protein
VAKTGKLILVMFPCVTTAEFRVTKSTKRPCFSVVLETLKHKNTTKMNGKIIYTFVYTSALFRLFLTAMTPVLATTLFSLL